MKWTRPFHGVSHVVFPKTSPVYCMTVEDHGLITKAFALDRNGRRLFEGTYRARNHVLRAKNALERFAESLDAGQKR